MDRANTLALWMTVGCVVVALGLLFVIPALTSSSGDAPVPTSNPPKPVALDSEPELESASSAPLSVVESPAPQTVESPLTLPEEEGETVVSPEPAVKSIRVFTPFPNGRIQWEGFDLPVVPASRENVRAYLSRMREFYDEFDRADRCRTEQERTEQAGRFIIDCDPTIGFDGVVVPDTHVEWTELFVQVIQIRAESMYLPWGPEEIEFRKSHNEGEIHERANALLEALGKNR